MTTQKVSAKQVSPLKGLFMIAAIAALLIVSSFLGSFIASRTGAAIWGQILLILVAGLAALYIMRNVVVEYQYTVADEVFYIERVYGKRSKVMIQIPLGDILYLGLREKALEKWPTARGMVKATVKDDPNPMTTVVYRANGQFCLAAIQPNESIKKALFDVEKRERSAKEKWG